MTLCDTTKENLSYQYKIVQVCINPHRSFYTANVICADRRAKHKSTLRIHYRMRRGPVCAVCAGCNLQVFGQRMSKGLQYLCCWIGHTELASTSSTMVPSFLFETTSSSWPALRYSWKWPKLYSVYFVVLLKLTYQERKRFMKPSNAASTIFRSERSRVKALSKSEFWFASQ